MAPIRPRSSLRRVNSRALRLWMYLALSASSPTLIYQTWALNTDRETVTKDSPITKTRLVAVGHGRSSNFLISVADQEGRLKQMLEAMAKVNLVVVTRASQIFKTIRALLLKAGTSSRSNKCTSLWGRNLLKHREARPLRNKRKAQPHSRMSMTALAISLR